MGRIIIILTTILMVSCSTLQPYKRPPARRRLHRNLESILEHAQCTQEDYANETDNVVNSLGL